MQYGLPVPLEGASQWENEARVERGFWPKLGRYAAELTFTREALAAYFCARDPATPTMVKATLMAALAYFVLPTDLVPDFVAGLGFTDDAAVLLTTLNTLAAHVKDTHRERAGEVLDRLSQSLK